MQMIYIMILGVDFGYSCSCIILPGIPVIKKQKKGLHARQCMVQSNLCVNTKMHLTLWSEIESITIPGNYATNKVHNMFISEEFNQCAIVYPLPALYYTY